MPNRVNAIHHNRMNLLRIIAEQGYVRNRDWADRLPMVSIEDFFCEGIAREATPNLAILSLGVAGFRDLLLKIRDRDDVADVVVQIWGLDEDEAWPSLAYIFVATSRSRETVRNWLGAAPPDLILRCGGVESPFVRARIIRAEEIKTRPGYQIHALSYVENMDHEES